jgi:transcriptional regulator with XRE-family HTH domain
MSPTAPQMSLSGESFGRRLRRERERRQIALASIAENTKISVSLFDDLERDELGRWPSGIFRRSFIRAYAQAVGLDPDETTREFLERFPDLNDPARAAAPATAKPTAKSTLRLTLADTNTSFIRGGILRSARSRCAALGVDATVISTMGLAIYTVLGTFWMPLCVALAGYYAGGILLLGNTPGVCLCAPGGNPTRPPGPSNFGGRITSRIRSSVTSMVPGFGHKPRHPARAIAD